jgi:hypothetical protein
LGNDLDRGRAVANDADSLSVPVAVLVPSGCLVEFRYVKTEDSNHLALWSSSPLKLWRPSIFGHCHLL